MDIKSKIRVIEDFPEKGISFKDITTLIKDGEAFQEVVNRIVDDLKGREVDYIAGPEARGFLLGAAVAYALGIGFIPIRKPGKLPAETVKHEYELEYGNNTLEIHFDAIEKGKKVAIVDDLLATGGTVLSAVKLIESIGGEVVALEFLIELEFLKGRDKLSNYHTNSLVKYDR
ncbi:adenine phosphoribosyltransferase [Tissierella carlieri]|uniref:adenine phosphoribosyltransferase n=1 Tax=Tissierella TaxID=41273 RepID=UPI000BA123DC|nr:MULTISPECIES: adenine phosphoribosyltransferase [Tissierella]MBU5311193.1 adenine phosphoribosyltransferase [Tissierella carlieri]MDU5082989.1 adenine phosphoribosyltransferase [Bacillota bacterium]OZV13564.1 adenine phosphoribosyltransferase [Tissierella sp. P1]